MTKEVRCVVVGAGAFGSAAACWLSRIYASDVTVLEQFAPGHTRGSSHDHSRLIRCSYEQVAYTALADAMFAAWTDVERESCTNLIVRTGALDLADADDAAAVAETEACARAMGAAGIPFERLDSVEVMRRWPQWHLSQEVIGLWHADAGIVDIERACRVNLGLAEANGAVIRSGVRVNALEDRGDVVLVDTTAGTFAAEHVVVCAGKWTTRLLKSLLDLPLRYTAEQVTYFASSCIDDYGPERFPVWLHRGSRGFYGAPAYGIPAVKAAEHLGGPEVVPDDEGVAVDPVRIRRVVDYLLERLPTAVGPPVLSRACLYELPPDGGLVLGPLPGRPRILLTIGAGHGAKFAALFGQILSQLVSTDGTSFPVEAFRPDRPSLSRQASD